MSIPVLFSFFLPIACQTEQPTPAQKDIILTSPKHAAAKEGDFDKMSFYCCDTKESTDLLNGYLNLTQAMAADDDTKTTQAVKALIPLSQQSTLSKEQELDPFLKTIPIWENKGRKEIQKNFKDASTAMISHAKKHKSETGTKVIVAYCPMAPEGPSRWLQVENGIRNPYFGSKMLECGLFEE